MWLFESWAELSAFIHETFFFLLEGRKDTLLLNNKIQLWKFKDQIGFMKRFMNQATSHLVNRKEPQRATEKEKKLKAEEGWDKEVMN